MREIEPAQKICPGRRRRQEERAVSGRGNEMGRAEEAPYRRAGGAGVGGGDGLRNYYLGHTHDLLLQLRVKTHNLHRLEAQRNDLNSKGTIWVATRVFVLDLGLRIFIPGVIFVTGSELDLVRIRTAFRLFLNARGRWSERA